MQLKRYTIMQDGRFIAAVYAENFREHKPKDGPGGHFYIGENVIASVSDPFLVIDSGGRTDVVNNAFIAANFCASIGRERDLW
jgi:hypothetical protein